MRSILLSIMALFIGLFLLLLGNSLLTTLLVLRGVAEDFSGKFLGLLTSVYFLGAFVATLVASKLIKRMGHIRCFTFCTALLGFAALAYVMLLSPLAWLVIRFLTGFGIFVVYTVVESWLNGQTQDAYRSRVFSIYTLINLIAVAASQQLLLIDNATGYTLFILAGMLVTAAIMPISWTRLQQPHVAVDMPSMSIRKVYDAAPVAVLGCLVSGLIMGPFWGLTPLFVSDLGYSENQLAAFISLSILGGAAIQYPVGRWSDTMDRRRVILFAFTGAALIALAMAIGAMYFAAERYVITALSAIFCGLVLAVYPISVVHLVDRIHKDHLVGGSSALLMVYGLGSFIGPALAGLSLEYVGVAALPTYYVMVLIVFSGLLTAQLVRSRIVEKPEEHESHYVAMVRTSQNVLPLHPDSEEVIPKN
ncbi:MFS transporter [Alteromonas oceanisediminis]|uniref:MFS transporter n=1 Tax=Alteromonas oceanisediminis TaxID=2836180 RepID=UPI001BDB0C87|nr:MFS transporter [Alteromonas oceanisediminis]MBT0585606.1 MFS transporter [Alteromonas oceanisediminis]